VQIRIADNSLATAAVSIVVSPEVDRGDHLNLKNLTLRLPFLTGATIKGFRNAYKEAVAWGFVDVFRKLQPDVVQYTYWDYFRNAFVGNFGWRIDHILATGILANRCRTAEVDMGPRKVAAASDHTIVWAEFD
jgi:hypothetical protein